jgi:hypothetical protein
MNKRMILLTALICASPVMNMIASQKSVAAMYNDFKKSVIDSDNQSLDSKLSKLHEVRNELIVRGEVMQKELNALYADRLGGFGLDVAIGCGALGLLYGVISCDDIYATYNSRMIDGHNGRYIYSDIYSRSAGARLGLFLSAVLFGVSYITYQNYQDRKICGKKIIEIDAIIVRLDTFKAQLEDELEKKHAVAV